ncbi:Crp/Fnr family transcriptional regulator [Flagellimonas sp.]|uniref:Crp/Fnr family transcriptional regulator n=1 Tax=Flagellimonas sp. TaxID=2058762 RepID=UPI003BAE1ECB
MNLSDSLHSTEFLKKEAYFLEHGKLCVKIGKIEKGVLRGFVYDSEGDEITTHFYQEGDMVVGSFLPNTQMTMSIQAMEDCQISIANYAEVMSYVNKDREITEIITREFQKLNHQLQSRLVSLLNLTSLEKYKRFLKDYPGLLNRIPHYHIANYLGITPTQLSRARKQFSQQM